VVFSLMPNVPLAKHSVLFSVSGFFFSLKHDQYSFKHEALVLLAKHSVLFIVSGFFFSFKHEALALVLFQFQFSVFRYATCYGFCLSFK
jgi:hypothetical protein